MAKLTKQKKRSIRRIAAVIIAPIGLFILCVLVVIGIILAAVYGRPAGKPPVSDSEFVVARGSLGAVATDDKRCSKAGVQVLEEGGNAVDAAVASLLCLGVVNFHTSGIGGGLMMLVAKKNTNAPEAGYTVTVIDAREVAPSSARESDYLPVDKRGKNIHMDTGWTRA